MKSGFLKTAFFLFFAIMALVMVVNAPAQKSLKSDHLDFLVLESDALYFRNLRQFYYSKTTRNDAQYELFRLKSTSDADYRNPAQFVIVNNWRNDMAYIMLSIDSALMLPDRFVIAATDTFDISAMNMEDQQYLASRVYSSLSDDEASYALVSDQNKIVDVWATKEAKKHLKIVLQDYFKLVGAL